MRLAFFAVIAVLCVAAAACDDDGGASGTPSATPTTADQFDPSVLTATVLNKNDVPGDFEVAGRFNPDDPTANGRAFTSVLMSDTLRIQSTVARYPDATIATQDFQRNRRVLPTFGASEENVDIEGAEAAFLYRVPTPPGTAIWGIVQNYVVFIQLAPVDTQVNPDPAAVDTDQLQAYATTVFARVNQVINDPASVTPVPLEEFSAAPPDATAVPTPSP